MLTSLKFGVNKLHVLDFRSDFEQITGDSNTASILFRHLAFIQGKPPPPEYHTASSEAEKEDNEENEETEEEILSSSTGEIQQSSSQSDEQEALKPNIIGKKIYFKKSR